MFQPSLVQWTAYRYIGHRVAVLESQLMLIHSPSHHFLHNPAVFSRPRVTLNSGRFPAILCHPISTLVQHFLVPSPHRLHKLLDGRQVLISTFPAALKLFLILHVIREEFGDGASVPTPTAAVPLPGRQPVCLRTPRSRACVRLSSFSKRTSQAMPVRERMPEGLYFQ